MRVLVLDDDRSRLVAFRRSLIGAVVKCVEHVADCIRELESNEIFDFVFLDHDLDGKVYVPSGPGTGYEVVQWIKNHPEKMPKHVILHTLNEIGAACMVEELPKAVYLPGVYMTNFSVNDLDNLKVAYKRYIEKF